MEANKGNQDVDIDTLKKSNEILKLNIETLERNIELLKTSNDALKSSNDILKKNNELLKRDNDTLKKDNEALRQNFEILKKNNETLSKNIDILEKKNETLDKNETAKTEEKEKQPPEVRIKSVLTDEFFKKHRIKIGLEKKRQQLVKVMMTLYAKGSMQVAEMKEETKIPNATMARIVQVLANAGWIMRQGSKRYGAYRLTDEGKRLCEN
jgi:predicted transcriptional regulator